MAALKFIQELLENAMLAAPGIDFKPIYVDHTWRIFHGITQRGLAYLANGVDSWNPLGEEESNGRYVRQMGPALVAFNRDTKKKYLMLLRDDDSVCYPENGREETLEKVFGPDLADRIREIPRTTK